MIKLKTILNRRILEDAASDREQRKKALNILGKLINYVERHGKDAFKEYMMPGSYYISGDDIIDKPRNIRFVFTDKFNDAKYYTTSIAGNHWRVVEIPVLNPEGDKLEDIVSRVKAKQSTIIHEIIHMLDDIRISPKKLSRILTRYVDSEKFKSFGSEYYNEPFEFNAWYQAAIADFERFIDERPEVLSALKEKFKDFRTFKEFAFSNLFDRKMLRNLTDENRKKVIKRLYKFFKEFKKRKDI